MQELNTSGGGLAALEPETALHLFPTLVPPTGRKGAMWMRVKCLSAARAAPKGGVCLAHVEGQALPQPGLLSSCSPSPAFPPPHPSQLQVSLLPSSSGIQTEAHWLLQGTVKLTRPSTCQCAPCAQPALVHSSRAPWSSDVTCREREGDLDN